MVQNVFFMAVKCSGQERHFAYGVLRNLWCNYIQMPSEECRKTANLVFSWIASNLALKEDNQDELKAALRLLELHCDFEKLNQVEIIENDSRKQIIDALLHFYKNNADMPKVLRSSVDSCFYLIIETSISLAEELAEIFANPEVWSILLNCWMYWKSKQSTVLRLTTVNIMYDKVKEEKRERIEPFCLEFIEDVIRDGLCDEKPDQVAALVWTLFYLVHRTQTSSRTRNYEQYQHVLHTLFTTPQMHVDIAAELIESIQQEVATN